MQMPAQIKQTILVTLGMELDESVRGLEAAKEKDDVEYFSKKIVDLRTAIKFLNSSN
ncbi:hypothetical protein [Undibacterium sp.]|uniref:hypothetical protein n=1 Tax=Undibacterium sp. TaxID=1914977 RepID=UPI0025F8CD6C|nr:hypothetical protein [Undibacterium sp.]